MSTVPVWTAQIRAFACSAAGCDQCTVEEPIAVLCLPLNHGDEDDESTTGASAQVDGYQTRGKRRSMRGGFVRSYLGDTNTNIYCLVLHKQLEGPRH